MEGENRMNEDWKEKMRHILYSIVFGIIWFGGAFFSIVEGMAGWYFFLSSVLVLFEFYYVYSVRKEEAEQKERNDLWKQVCERNIGKKVDAK